MTRFANLCKAMSVFLFAACLWGQEAQAESVYDFSFTAIEGGRLDLADHQGKVIMVVNTASLCGFTPQYEGLQRLWERYQDRGFVLIGVPSGDFGGQEHRSADKIKDFCETTFGIDFPLADRTSVSGPKAHPFYRWAVQELGPKHQPRWNFHKYLIGADGQLITSFATRIRPDDSSLIDSLETALKGLQTQ